MKLIFITAMLGTALTLLAPLEFHQVRAENATGKKLQDKIGITSFYLENGMQVVVIPDRRAPVVTHMVWYKAGSSEDPIGKSGIAHFLEHLMFKGTKTVPVGEFSAKIAEIGGQENAFTSTDYTSYYQKVSPDALKMTMTYEADRMENLVLSKDAIGPERDVILEERRSRIDSSPGGILSEVLESTLFLHHPYGNPIIGYENEIRGLNRKDAIAFYDKYYTPNNAVLIIAGDIDEQTVRIYAKETYGKVKRRAEPGFRQRIKEPEPVAARKVTYHDVRVTSPSLSKIFFGTLLQHGKTRRRRSSGHFGFNSGWHFNGKTLSLACH